MVKIAYIPVFQSTLYTLSADHLNIDGPPFPVKYEKKLGPLSVEKLHVGVCVCVCETVPFWVPRTHACLVCCPIPRCLDLQGTIQHSPFCLRPQCRLVSSLFGPDPSWAYPRHLSFPFPAPDNHSEYEQTFLFLFRNISITIIFLLRFY